jgi:hypothetical protein
MLNKFDQHSIGAYTTPLCHTADLRCETRRQSNALAHFLVRYLHCSIYASDWCYLPDHLPRPHHVLERGAHISNRQAQRKFAVQDRVRQEEVA